MKKNKKNKEIFTLSIASAALMVTILSSLHPKLLPLGPSTAQQGFCVKALDLDRLDKLASTSYIQI